MTGQKNELIDAIYSPTTGTIGCVLIQAAYGCNRHVAQMFDTDDWDTAPSKTQSIMRATRTQWQNIASMKREDRVALWNSKTGATHD